MIYIISDTKKQAEIFAKKCLKMKTAYGIKCPECANIICNEATVCGRTFYEDDEIYVICKDFCKSKFFLNNEYRIEGSKIYNNDLKYFGRMAPWKIEEDKTKKNKKMVWQKWNGMPIDQAQKDSMIEHLLKIINDGGSGCLFSICGETMFIAAKGDELESTRIYETVVRKVAYIENKENS